MEVLDTKTNEQLLTTLIAEIAKCKNEISCASGDIAKAQGRLGFLLVLANTLINRTDIKKEDQK